MAGTAGIKQQNVEIKQTIAKEIEDVKIHFLGPIVDIRKENVTLKYDNEALKEKLEVVERKSKKFNLVIYGLQEESDEVEEIKLFFF